MISDLLDALGTAKEGNPRLDWEIEQTINPDGPYPNPTPTYSRSIDAALQLVPEGWIWNVASSGCAWVMPPGDLDGQLVIGGIESPAIALCIAALKARAAHDTEKK